MPMPSQAPCDDNAQDILDEEGQAPDQKLFQREGAQMGVDMEKFGGEDGDEEEGEPVQA